MKRLVFATAVCGALLPATFGVAATASAAPARSSAADTVADLRAQGYSVQINGSRNGPLSECSVNSVRTTANTTVYVDLSCPHVYIDD
jgi:hypothetical protein